MKMVYGIFSSEVAKHVFTISALPRTHSKIRQETVILKLAFDILEEERPIKVALFSV